MAQKLKNYFEAFNNLKVLVIGDVMIDSYLWGHVDRISPEAPVPVVSVTKRDNRLGGAANVALNIQALGATPILLSAIGNDDKADTMLQLLHQNNMPDTGIVRFDKRITTTKFRVIGNNYQLLRVDEEETSAITYDMESILLAKVSEILANTKIDAIIFEDYNKGVITPRLIKNIVKEANQKSIPTAVDPKLKNFLAYKDVTLFKPNLKELKEGLKLLQLNKHNNKEIQEAIKSLQQQIVADNIMVTLSERGVYIYSKTLQKHIPAHIRNISDVSGAGDTVISVATLCLALGMDIERLSALANLAGGLVCEEVGVVSVDKTKLYNEALKLDYFAEK